VGAAICRLSLAESAADRISQACEKSAWPALRSLVLLAVTTGARKGELTGLKWADVDLTKGRARVRETKNDESRTVPPAGQTPQALRDLKLKNSARSESMLAAQGASLLEITDVLGHKTLAMVKRYSHLVVDHKPKVIEKMIAAKGL
jgi:integrase